MRYSSCREIDRIVRSLLRQGWIVKSRKAHTKLYHDGERKTLIVPYSPSDGRAVRNFEADVRRAGFVCKMVGHS